jgi:3-dehydroquinate synthase
MKSKLLCRAWPELFKEFETSQSTFYAVIDIKVKPHLPEWMLTSDTIFWVDRPEAQKNLKTYEALINFFLERGISRSCVLYAIGGGATTDLAGFFAATILRGISWISVPTTILGMVDASIGGKVAVNMAQGKNLVGAFYHPEKIYICHEFLTTLPQEEVESGKGEILKYGFLSKKIHQQILSQENIENLAFECAHLKEQIVERDFTEKSERMLLNLGHTLGHAFELALNIPHGVAVGMGIRYILEIFGDSSFLKDWEMMCSALGLDQAKYHLSTYPSFSSDQFKQYLGQDKKKSENKIKLVLVRNIGDCYIQEMDLNEFFKKIEDHAEFYR